MGNMRNVSLKDLEPFHVRRTTMDQICDCFYFVPDCLPDSLSPLMCFRHLHHQQLPLRNHIFPSRGPAPSPPPSWRPCGTPPSGPRQVV